MKPLKKKIVLIQQYSQYLTIIVFLIFVKKNTCIYIYMLNFGKGETYSFDYKVSHLENINTQKSVLYKINCILYKFLILYSI